MIESCFPVYLHWTATVTIYYRVMHESMHVVKTNANHKFVQQSLKTHTLTPIHCRTQICNLNMHVAINNSSRISISWYTSAVSAVCVCVCDRATREYEAKWSNVGLCVSMWKNFHAWRRKKANPNERQKKINSHRNWYDDVSLCDCVDIEFFFTSSLRSRNFTWRSRAIFVWFAFFA